MEIIDIFQTQIFIIYHLNGVELATNFLRKYILDCFISRITFIEVLSFDFNEFERSSVIDTSENIALQCLKNREKKKINLPDNIIASTAQVNDLILVSRNVKDFKDLDIKLLDIFI